MLKLHLASSHVQAHARGVLSLAEAKGFIVSTGYDGAVRLWHTNNNELKLWQELDGGSSTGPVFSAAAAPVADDTIMVCAGSYCRRLRVWHCPVAAPPKLFWESTQHTGWVRALTLGATSLYSIGCNRILSWSLAKGSPAGPRTADDELALYEDDREVDVVAHRSHDILCLAHNEPDEVIASGSVDGALRAWSSPELDGGAAGDLLAGDPDHWIGHAGRVAAVTWQGGRLLSCGYDGYVRSWRRPSRGQGAAAAATPWELLDEVRVASSREGRALNVACGASEGGAPGARPPVLCGTSDGEIVLLGGAELEAVDRLQLGGDGAADPNDSRRATAIVSVPQARASERAVGDEAERELFVVGDSKGDLHVVAAL